MVCSSSDGISSLLPENQLYVLSGELIQPKNLAGKIQQWLQHTYRTIMNSPNYSICRHQWTPKSMLCSNRRGGGGSTAMATVLCARNISNWIRREDGDDGGAVFSVTGGGVSLRFAVTGVLLT